MPCCGECAPPPSSAFHNQDDRQLFVGKGIVRSGQAAVVTGSGIDLEQFAPAGAHDPARPSTFLFIGRFLEDKGVREFIEAANMVKERTSARFEMVEVLEDHPKAVARDLVEAAVSDGTIVLLGTTSDVRPYIADADCVMLPSYREGLPRGSSRGERWRSIPL